MKGCVALAPLARPPSVGDSDDINWQGLLDLDGANYDLSDTCVGGNLDNIASAAMWGVRATWGAKRKWY